MLRKCLQGHQLLIECLKSALQIRNEDNWDDPVRIFRWLTLKGAVTHHHFSKEQKSLLHSWDWPMYVRPLTLVVDNILVIDNVLLSTFTN